MVIDITLFIIYLLIAEDPTDMDKVGATIAAFFLVLFSIIYITAINRIIIPSFGKKKLVVEQLRASGLLSFARVYNYFKEIQAIPFYQKLKQYGEEFLENFLTIMHLKTLKKIR
ncbi:MAG: hypothetical protein ACFFCI_20490 [Promethearchaeota archaeon]